jgi:hypothetical protein
MLNTDAGIRMVKSARESVQRFSDQHFEEQFASEFRLLLKA